MPPKKSRLTGKVSKDLPLPPDHAVKGEDGKSPSSQVMGGKIIRRYDESAKNVIQSMRG